MKLWDSKWGKLIKNHHHSWREQTAGSPWHTCLQGLRLGAVLWLLFLTLPCRENEGDKIKRVLAPIVLLLVLLPLAYLYEQHPYMPGSSFKLKIFLASGGALALLGLLDPRLWFALPVLAMNSSTHQIPQDAAHPNAMRILGAGGGRRFIFDSFRLFAVFELFRAVHLPPWLPI